MKRLSSLLSGILSAVLLVSTATAGELPSSMVAPQENNVVASLTLVAADARGREVVFPSWIGQSFTGKDSRQFSRNVRSVRRSRVIRSGSVGRPSRREIIRQKLLRNMIEKR
ncbi:hypothetical protein A2635_04195 [Candidatus Peribacteria bacterium RIFCSPHIGHO2_01_FULL_51_9]|nr:MAG: hypothetical protein A2635_04195 [Candidatus Peribacteria bacterium RIFCSPHIGHO2_01_FULL_51_9]